MAKGIIGALLGLLTGWAIGTALQRIANGIGLDSLAMIFIVICAAALGALLGGLVGAVTGAIIGALLGALTIKLLFTILILVAMTLGAVLGWRLIPKND